MRILFKRLIGLLVVLLVFSGVPTASGQVIGQPITRSSDLLPLPQPVIEDEATLTRMGCQYPTLDTDSVPNFGGQPTIIYNLTFIHGWRYVIPEVGKKKLIYGPFDPTRDNGFEVGMFCSPEIFRALTKTAATVKPLTGVEAVIVQVINFILAFLANIGLWLLKLAADLASYFMTMGSFITNPYVQQGWPFVQGIANIGFLLALLFIAAATTLQLDDWGIKRMLPRLLIAALLINFSLVIGGVLIDASRIIMALLVTVMGGGGVIGQLGNGIIKSSGIIQGVFDTNTNSIVSPGNYSWQISLKMAEACLQIYAITIGLVLIAVGLIARYIALILLLIFSPLAYLAFAFPNTGPLATKWWTEFLKWVFYGPVMLFFLVLVVVLGEGFAVQNFVDDRTGTLFDIAITTALLVAAFKSGKSFAGHGSEAAINFATKLPGLAARYPKTTAALVGGVAVGPWAALAAAATVGLGKRSAQGAHLLGRDFIKPVKKTLFKGAKYKTGFIGKTLFGPERDEQGNLLKGEDSFAARWGRKVSAGMGTPGGEPLYPKGHTTFGWENDMRDAFGSLKEEIDEATGDFKPGAFDHIRSSEAYKRLDVKQVATAMKDVQAKAILYTALDGKEDHTVQDFTRLWDMVRSPYAYNNIKEAERIQIAELNAPDVINNINLKRGLRGEGAISNEERARLERLITDIKKSASSSRNTVSGDDWV